MYFPRTAEKEIAHLSENFNWLTPEDRLRELADEWR